MLKLLFISLFILFIGCADNNKKIVTAPIIYIDNPTIEHNSDTIYVKFNTNLSENSVNERTIYLLDSQDNIVDVDLKLLYYTNEILLRPYSYLPISADYTVVVTTGIQDINNNHLKVNYRYDFTTEKTIPILDDLKVNVAEDQKSGGAIGQIDIRTTGDNNILSIDLIGVGSSFFQVSTLGYLTLAQGKKLDFETTTSYSLTAIATNTIGKSDPVSVDINVTNVAEVVPTLLKSTATVSEDAQAGAKVGEVLIDSIGDHYILSMDIDGSGSKNFNVSDKGKITVSADANLDYETKNLYDLTVSAANGAGDSESVPLTIHIRDVDTVAKLDDSTGRVDENALGGILVGQIKILSDGDNNISSITLSGFGHENFEVTPSGEIKVVDGATLDYETKNSYHLTAIAKNSAGDSNKINVSIELNNIENPFLIAKLEADDAQRDDNYGKSIAVSGNYVVVGASQEDSTADNSGAVYVYKKDEKGVLTQIAKLKADDAQKNDYFGYSVAIDGDYIVVGAYKEDTGEKNAGKVYIFKRKSDDTNDVVQIAKIQSDKTQEDAMFGNAVAISGKYIAVGASHENVGTEDDAGAVYLFKKESDSTNDITQIAKLTASNAGKEDWFGHSLSIDGDYIIVGAYGEDSENIDAGASYLFKRNSNEKDDTSQIAMILIHNSRDYDYFGYSVAISGNYILVGAYGEDTTANGAGTAYLLKRESDNEDDVTLLKTIQVKEPHEKDYFGKSVAMDGTYMIIGASSEDVDEKIDAGTAYLFRRDLNDETDIIQVSQLKSKTIQESEFFGSVVSISQDNIAIATQKKHDEIDSYLFDIEPLDKVYFYNSAISSYNEKMSGTFISHFDARSPRSTDISFTLTGTDGDLFNFKEKDLHFNQVPDYEKPQDGGRDNSYKFTVIATDEYEKEASMDIEILVKNRYFLQASKVQARHPNADDAFAQSISISGDYVAVGVPYYDGTALGSGCAYLFKKDDDGVLQQIARFEAEDGQKDDNFGHSISISGNYIAVGAYMEDTTDENAGTVYLFKRNSDRRDDVHQIAKIQADDAEKDDWFGYSVAIDENYIAVGAFQEDTKADNAGSVYLFRRDSDDNNNFTQVAKLNADDEDANDNFGYAVDISGNYIVVGAYKYEDEDKDSNNDDSSNNNNSSSDDSDSSSNMGGGDDGGDDDSGDSGDSGDDSSSSGGYGGYGAPSLRKADSQDDSDDNTNTGIAYLFKRNTDTNNDTSQIAKFTSDDVEGYDYFGKSVAIDGDYIVVGAYNEDFNDINNSGSAYLFKRKSDEDNDVSQIAKLDANDSEEEDWFGYSLDISGDFIAIGSYRSDVVAEDTGAVYLFKRKSDTNVTQIDKIDAYDGEKNDYFGYSVSIDADKVAVGAFNEDTTKENAGSAYLFIKDKNEKE